MNIESISSNFDTLIGSLGPEESNKISTSIDDLAKIVELINNKLRIFPIPKSAASGDKIWFQYYVRGAQTLVSSSHTTGKVSDPSNVPFKFITYSEINASGRQWIKKFTLALAKELLGII